MLHVHTLLSEDSKETGGAQRLPPSPPAEDFYIIDDVLRNLVRDAPDEPLVGYPKSAHGVADYVYYTPSDLDRFTNGAVKEYKRAGLAEVSIRAIVINLFFFWLKNNCSSPIRLRTV